MQTRFLVDQGLISAMVSACWSFYDRTRLKHLLSYFFFPFWATKLDSSILDAIPDVKMVGLDGLFPAIQVKTLDVITTSPTFDERHPVFTSHMSKRIINQVINVGFSVAFEELLLQMVSITRSPWTTPPPVQILGPRKLNLRTVF